VADVLTRQLVRRMERVKKRIKRNKLRNRDVRQDLNVGKLYINWSNNGHNGGTKGKMERPSERSD